MGKGKGRNWAVCQFGERDAVVDFGFRPGFQIVMVMMIQRAGVKGCLQRSLLVRRE